MSSSPPVGVAPGIGVSSPKHHTTSSSTVSADSESEITSHSQFSLNGVARNQSGNAISTTAARGKDVQPPGEGSPYGTRYRGRARRVNYNEDTDDEEGLPHPDRRVNGQQSLQKGVVSKESRTQKVSKKRKLPSASPSMSASTHKRPHAVLQRIESQTPQAAKRRSLDNGNSVIGRTTNVKNIKRVVSRSGSSTAGATNGTRSKNRNSSKSKSASPPPAKSDRNLTKPPLLRKVSSVKVEVVSNILDFTDARMSSDGVLTLIDGSTYAANDYIYLVSEPPSEPYYIGRIMEFVERPELSQKSATRTGFSCSVLDVYQLRVNWFYRPKDIPTRSNDSRLLFATMHSDICPLLSMRGKCVVTHRAHIKDLVEYRKVPDHFWFDKLYDRYICRFYEMIPTEKILNVPEEFGKVLRERVKYAVIEIGRGKSLSSAARNCTRCGQWCPPDESVCCAVCGNDYHMSCVRPPLTKKPTRGFAWACAICSRDKERRMAERKGKLLPGTGDEVDDFHNGQHEGENGSSDSSYNSQTATAVVDDEEEFKPHQTPEFKISDSKLTNEQKKELSLWPYRYLGVHCKLEEVLDNNDRIYPHAASRIGNKHQAVVSEWGERPVQFIEPDPAKAKKKKTHKVYTKKNATPVTPATLEETAPDSDSTTPTTPYARQPSLSDGPWVQEKPIGYIERGGDDTATLLWKTPIDVAESSIDDFLERTKPYANAIGMTSASPNFIDSSIRALMDCDFDRDKALELVSKFTRKSLKEPTFTQAEVKRFEEGVRKYGSELHPVYRAVGTVPSADIVRFYYLWKKTSNGHAIWDHFEGRRGKKDVTKPKGDESAAKPTVSSSSHSQPLVDLVADSQDDSAYDMEKCRNQNQSFRCKFCNTTKSRAWRRAPGYPVAKTNATVALCIRCAELWRRYAVVWEDPIEVLKKSNQRGSGGQKRKVEEEVLRELEEGNRYDSESFGLKDYESEVEDDRRADALVQQENKKGVLKRSASSTSFASGSTPMSGYGASKKKGPLTPGSATLPSECGVCGSAEPREKLLRCHSCQMCVHRSCYGVRDAKKKWLCEPCQNDRNPRHSMTYECALCPVQLYEDIPQGEKTPRDPLKFTSGNNWMHVLCAVWTPEIKFTDSYTMNAAEGIGLIPKTKFLDVCEICHLRQGACTSCAVCHVPFHVGCAFKAHYKFGFDVQPVKSTRRDSVSIVKLGSETGVMTPMIWCPKHDLRKLTIHEILEPAPATALTNPTLMSLVGGGVGPEKAALNVYTQTYKQADLSLTGTVRRAQQIIAVSKFLNMNLDKMMERKKSTPTAEQSRLVVTKGSRRASSAETISQPSDETESTHTADTEPQYKVSGHECLMGYD
ncbi:hypothetical protein POJ06DRAFT_205786 [Lipomyces tetrasporus]|uniref:Uncharacterized protein n=1 Tax=Lipomyces tetrasporus TaxID=54092 RepID=A0AAD7VV31_9ASCO|nr:uncharacterized protein POJ06DRAFT_205786 [Lipomyces tetrasporus]KAJ8102551.1 hypothetical protein POJ06DRAFT_205786 [Lipomyces tetrasporus]